MPSLSPSDGAFVSEVLGSCWSRLDRRLCSWSYLVTTYWFAQSHVHYGYISEDWSLNRNEHFKLRWLTAAEEGMQRMNFKTERSIRVAEPWDDERIYSADFDGMIFSLNKHDRSDCTASSFSRISCRSKIVWVLYEEFF